jgi:hypothetical protein
MTDEPVGPGYRDYAARVDARFTMQLPDGGLAPLVLTECSASGPQSFQLVFKAGPPAPKEQAIYLLSADGLGPEPVFLVPVGARPDDPEYPLEYHAVFNSQPIPGWSD